MLTIRQSYSQLINFLLMKLLEFIVGLVIFKLCCNQIYQLKTTKTMLTIFCKDYPSTRTVCFRSWWCCRHVCALAHRHAHYKEILFSAMIWVILLSTITLLEHKVVTHTSWIGLKGYHHMQKRVTRSLIVKVFWTFSLSSFFFFSFLLHRINTVKNENTLVIFIWYL